MTDHAPLTEAELEEDAVACYFEAVAAIGALVKTRKRRLPRMFRPRPKSFWTPERVDRLHMMRSDASMSFPRIAAALGCTKNAAIGRIHRDEEKYWVPVIRVYPFDDMTTKECRFPIGNPGDPDFHFCRIRIETEGRSYCNEHHRRSVIKKVNAEDLA